MKRIIVSLTSYGYRINSTLPETIKSLNNCLSYTPDRIVVYIANSDKDFIDYKLFRNFNNVEFRFVNDYMSHKKFFGLTEKEFQSDFVVIADDDLNYKTYFFQKLFEKYEQHKSETNFIVCNRAQRLTCKKYREKPFILKDDIDSGRMVFGSGSGLLIPPYTMRFEKDVIEQGFKVSPHCDETFYSAYCISKNIKTFCTGKPQPFNLIPLPKADPTGLWTKYNSKEKDTTFFKVFDYFKIDINEKVFVSFTSWTKRIQFAADTVRRMKKQTYTPEKIILTLAESEFPNKEKDLPKDLLKELDCRFEIRWCKDNCYTFKKLLPLFYIHPEHWILIIDDDVIYSDNFIESMVFSATDDSQPITGSDLKTYYFEYGNVLSANGAFTLIKPKHCLPYLKDIFESISKTTLDIASDPILTYSVFLNKITFRKSKTNYRNLQAKYNGKFPEPYSGGKQGIKRNENTHTLFHKWASDNNISLGVSE